MLPSAFAEKGRGGGKAYAGEPGNEADSQTAEPIGDASPEIDRRGLLKVFCRAAYFTDGIPPPDNLGEKLIIENKVVRHCF